MIAAVEDWTKPRFGDESLGVKIKGERNTVERKIKSS
jgi:hypothetical protein